MSVSCGSNPLGSLKTSDDYSISTGELRNRGGVKKKEMLFNSLDEKDDTFIFS